MEPIVLVHGGAGDTQTSKRHDMRMKGVKSAAKAGYTKLHATKNAIDAVEEAIKIMELEPTLNAAYGSTLTIDGKVENDAAIMNGEDLNGDCVAGITNIQHPISVARKIMTDSMHTFLAGQGAMTFAKEKGFQILCDNSLVTEDARNALNFYKQNLYKDIDGLKTYTSSPKTQIFDSPGTVGAVAMDEFGNLAAGTSTGGLCGKLNGRIGDSPILGAGTYADNATGAISLTGHGETIMRYKAASRILSLIEYKNATAKESCKIIIDQMKSRFNQTAGAIIIDAKGNIGIYFSTENMPWAYQRGNQLHYGAHNKEDIVETVGLQTNEIK